MILNYANDVVTGSTPDDYVYLGNELVWERYKPEPVYDETQIALIELDSFGRRTKNITYVHGSGSLTPAQNVYNTLSNLPSDKLYDLRYGSMIEDSELDDKCRVLIDHSLKIEILKPFPSLPDRYVDSFYSNLKEVVLANGIVKLGDYCFDYCKKLEKINLPDSIQEIGFDCFGNSVKLSTIHIPKTLKILKSGAFRYSGIQNDIVLPQTIQELGTMVFAYSNINSITIGGGRISKIPYDTCYRCKSLKSVKIVNGVTAILDDAFRECTSLINVELPSSIQKIDTLAFAGCTALKEIEIPSSIEEIHYRAFEECNGIRIIIHKSENSIPGAPWGATNAEVIWTG